MTELILHIGTHKTGTTSIQRALTDNRAWLRANGLIYPGGGAAYPGQLPHHKWSHALTGAPGRHRQTARDYIRDVVRTVRRGDRILISAEPIYRHIAGFDTYDVFQRPDYWIRREQYLKTCANVLACCDVQVVVWFRERSSFARSLYAEMAAKQHWQGAFDRFLEVYAVWFEYERQLALVRRAFPKVAAFSYEDDARQGLIPSFFRRIDCPMPPGAQHIWERRSSPGEPA